MKLPYLYFITQDHPQLSHVEQARRACERGVSWVQLRVKGWGYLQWLKAAEQVVCVCSDFNVRCLVNDNVEIARDSGAHGVHLGLSDTSPLRAREILGPKALIGATVHNLEEARATVGMPIDYVGVGPYRFTTTKEDLSPLLGIDGVRQIREELSQLNPLLPVVAVGGIKLGDLEILGSIGVDGVALSGGLIETWLAPEPYKSERDKSEQSKPELYKAE
jgi:thiamine-phosphate pyrophosphorylase